MSWILGKQMANAQPLKVHVRNLCSGQLDRMWNEDDNSWIPGVIQIEGLLEKELEVRQCVFFFVLNEERVWNRCPFPTLWRSPPPIFPAIGGGCIGINNNLLKNENIE